MTYDYSKGTQTKKIDYFFKFLKSKGSCLVSQISVGVQLGKNSWDTSTKITFL